MSKNTTNHSDLPCTCGTLEQYVDGLCPGCIEAADRDADLKESCEGACDAGRACHDEDESAVREGDDDRYYSGTGESMDDSSYERYLNRG
jgi:hypothetical protein